MNTTHFTYKKKSNFIRFLCSAVGTYFALQLIIMNHGNYMMQALGGIALFVLIPSAVKQMSKLLSKTNALSVTDEGIVLNMGENESQQVLWSEIDDVKEVIISDHKKMISVVLRDDARILHTHLHKVSNQAIASISIPTWILNCNHEELFRLIKERVHCII